MKWFGETWHAPICEPSEHVERPEAECMYCDAELVDGDRGVVMPYLEDLEKPATWVAAHLECFLGALGLAPIAIDITRDLARRAARSVAPAHPDVVHILSRGYALCGFSEALPREWPPGHRWVSPMDWFDASCGDCKARYRREPDLTRTIEPAPTIQATDDLVKGIIATGDRVLFESPDFPPGPRRRRPK